MYFIKNGLGEKWKWLGGFVRHCGNHLFRDRQCGTDQRHFGVLWDLRRSDMDHGADPAFLLIASVLLGACGASAT